MPEREEPNRPRPARRVDDPAREQGGPGGSADGGQAAPWFSRSGVRALQASAGNAATAGKLQRYATKGAVAKGAFSRSADESEDDFRQRMAAEMTSLRTGMQDKEEDPSKLQPGERETLAPRFLTKMRSERDRELEQLRGGTLAGGRTLETEGLDEGALGPRLTMGSDVAQAGPSVSGPLPPAWGASKLPGMKRSVKTRDTPHGSALWAKLENPAARHGHALQGITARHAEIEAIAKKADAFMRTLAAGGDLTATHEPKKAHQKNNGTAKAGYDTSGPVLRRGDGSDVYAYGLAEYGNRPTFRPKDHVDADPTAPDYPERLLPALDATTRAPGVADKGAHSRIGHWSEADVDPRTVTDSAKGTLGGRNAARLLHTAAGSVAERPDAKGGTEMAPVEHRFWVTGDHYMSGVPVEPVATGYAASNPYQPAYEDPTKYSVNSFEYQKKVEAERLQAEAREAARRSAEEREQRTEEQSLALLASGALSAEVAEPLATSPEAVAGAGSTADAGPQAVADVGPQAVADAGPQADADAGPQAAVDAGPQADAGAQADVDVDEVLPPTVPEPQPGQSLLGTVVGYVAAIPRALTRWYWG